MVSLKIRKVDTENRTFTKECTEKYVLILQAAGTEFLFSTVIQITCTRRTNINLLEKDSSFTEERTHQTTGLRALEFLIYTTPSHIHGSSAVHKLSSSED